MAKERTNNLVTIRMPLPLKLAAIEACLDQDRALAAVVIDALTDYLTARGYVKEAQKNERGHHVDQ